ncbi:hypothetical protein M8C13_09115 [Crossiella sp. SN42]|uniref:hypothetical protein n=1 Tax=Crossiella sp. SN42 TaxID=2944808 RepID=UPI00207CC171|nr:hypothetical protein [Crossiella sp. SN42]MCO1575916.1 hypothetical protein [Crossiella sp. SN42]
MGSAESPVERSLVRQLIAAQRFLGDRGRIVRVFVGTAIPAAPDSLAELGDRTDAPSLHVGGWPELAGWLAAPDRDFDAVVCSDFSRLGRSDDRIREREDAAAMYGVAILCADQAWPGTSPVQLRPSQRHLFFTLASARSRTWTRSASRRGRSYG